MEASEALTVLGGVATAQELLRCTNRRRLRAALADQTVVRERPGRYRLPDADIARVAATRVGGVVSHLSAAQDWGWKIKAPPEKPCVSVPRRSCHLDADDLEVHWADLDLLDVSRGVTDPLRTVVDCARAYPFDVALSVADSALRSGIERADLAAAALRAPRTGRRRAVRVVEAADPRADNPFESVLRAIALDVPGLEVEPQQWVADVGRVDLMDVGRRLVIEAESFEFHSDRASLRRDVHRYTAFVRLGYRVVRFTWEDVMFDPAYVRGVLADLVA